MDEPKKVDPAKASEKLEAAQEAVALCHRAYQACTKAWDSMRDPSDAKRAMWKAVESARAGFAAAVKTEARHFGVMQVLVGQGDLFNGGDEEAPGGVRGGPDDTPPGEPGAGGGTALVPPRNRRGRGTSPAN